MRDSSLTLLVFNHIINCFFKLYPFSMSLVMFALAFQMLKRFIITMNYNSFFKEDNVLNFTKY